MLRFVLDVHLGRLARQLRTLGFDVLWSQDYADDPLLEISNSENRQLLTRDRELSRRGDPARTHYVKATEPQAQIIEVIRHYDLTERVRSGEGFLSRCLDCNFPIVPLRGEQLVFRVPGQIRLQFNEFFLCPRCERVFWKGSHFDRMQAWVRKVLEESGETPSDAV